jgi:hypothetical protein
MHGGGVRQRKDEGGEADRFAVLVICLILVGHEEL